MFNNRCINLIYTVDRIFDNLKTCPYFNEQICLHIYSSTKYKYAYAN